MPLKIVKDSQPDKFSLEYQFQQFLKITGQKEKDMHHIQKQQIKATFMHTWIQCISCLTLDVSKLDDNEAINTLDYMERQVVQYFQSIKNSN